MRRVQGNEKQAGYDTYPEDAGGRVHAGFHGEEEWTGRLPVPEFPVFCQSTEEQGAGPFIPDEYSRRSL